MDQVQGSTIISSQTDGRVKDSAHGSFGKEGEATILLDRALQIIQNGGNGALCSEITALDNELQDFLHSQLVSFRGSRARECLPIVVTLR